MNKPVDIANQSNPIARQFIIPAIFTTLLIFSVYYTNYFLFLRVPLAFILLIVLCYLIFIAIKFYRLGFDALPRGWLLAGIFFVSGGAAFDGLATLAKSPDLSLEANPVIRSLIEYGLPVSLIIPFGIIAQVLLVLLTCVLWAGFLRHRNTLISSIDEIHYQSMTQFIKAAFGGAHLSWRQYLLPMKLADLPKAYHTVLALGAIFAGAQIYRWYLGFSWLGFNLNVRNMIVSLISLLLAISGYIIWLIRKFNEHSSKDTIL